MLPIFQIVLHLRNSLRNLFALLRFRELILELKIVFDIKLFDPGKVVGSKEVDTVHLLLNGWPFYLWRRNTNLNLKTNYVNSKYLLKIHLIVL